MWCSDWAELLCTNVSWLEKHPLKFLAICTRGLEDASEPWGRRGRVVHVSWAFGTVGGDLSATLGDWFVHF